MSERKDKDARRAVLTDFMTGCPAPSADDVRLWVKDHPDHADAISELAETLMELAIYRGPGPLERPTAAELERAHALSSSAMRELGVDLGEADKSFKDLVERSGSNVPKLETETGVPRDVIGAMEAGWMSPPVNPRMLEAIASALKVPREIVAAAIAAAAAAPRVAPAKATERPTVTQRTYRQIVENSSMSDERKAYWLGED
jgi:hypothetical protein